MWQKSRGWRNRSNAAEQAEIPVQSKVTAKAGKNKTGSDDSIQAAAEALSSALESEGTSTELPVVNIDTEDLLTELPPINISSADDVDRKPLPGGAGDETTELPIFKEAAAFAVADRKKAENSEKKDVNAPTKELPVFEETAAAPTTVSSSAASPSGISLSAAAPSAASPSAAAPSVAEPDESSHKDDPAESPYFEERQAPLATAAGSGVSTSGESPAFKTSPINRAEEKEDQPIVEEKKDQPIAEGKEEQSVTEGTKEKPAVKPDELTPAVNPGEKPQPKSGSSHPDAPGEPEPKKEKDVEDRVLHEAEEQTRAMEALALSDSAEIANGGPHAPKAADTTPEQKLETYRMKYERVLERCLVLGRQVQDLQVALAKAERALQANLIEKRKIEDNQRAVLAAEGRVEQAKKMIESILTDSRKELAAATAKATKQQEIAERAEKAKAAAVQIADDAKRRAENAESQLHELATAARREQKQLLKKIEVMW